MILILGGTAEMRPLAEKAAAAGYRVMVSTLTDHDFGFASSENIISPKGLETRFTPVLRPGCFRISGQLDHAGLTRLHEILRFRAIVDATHPYAVNISKLASGFAGERGIAFLTFARPPTAMNSDNIFPVGDHSEAARVAFSFGKPVLLTTGSRNLLPYAELSKKLSLLLVVRVTPTPEALAACDAAGIERVKVIRGYGPYSVDDNLRTIREYGIGVLVTKDGGGAGGVPEKLEAAQKTGCNVVVVSRPIRDDAQTFDNIEEIVDRLEKLGVPADKPEPD